MKISELTADMKKIDVVGAIKSKSDARNVNLKTGGTNQTCDAQLADETGEVKLVLWGSECSNVKVGDGIKIENGYTTAYKGVTQLAVGKFGKLTIVGGKPFATALGPTLEERIEKLEAAVFSQ